MEYVILLLLIIIIIMIDRICKKINKICRIVAGFINTTLNILKEIKEETHE